MGNRSPNKTPLKIDDNTFVFGHASDWYKMVAVDAQGNKIENRYMSKALALTKANWENANRGGSYSASDVKMCDKASAAGKSTFHPSVSLSLYRHSTLPLH